MAKVKKQMLNVQCVFSYYDNNSDSLYSPIAYKKERTKRRMEWGSVLKIPAEQDPAKRNHVRKYSI